MQTEQKFQGDRQPAEFNPVLNQNGSEHTNRESSVWEVGRGAFSRGHRLRREEFQTPFAIAGKVNEEVLVRWC